jgi:prevent-host-death family protein
MITVTIRAAKTHLTELIEKVEAGEEVVITRRREPVAKIVAIAKPSKKRVLGQYRGGS